MNNAFSKCKNLTKITIPDNVTNIGAETLLKCFSLNKIIIPKNIQSIGTNILNECNNLKYILYKGNFNEWDNINGINNINIGNNGEIYFYSENQPLDDKNY